MLKNSFCPNCRSLILKENGNICNICDEQIKLAKPTANITEKVYKKHNINKNTGSKGAKIDQICDECGREQMYYKAIQTRSADEGQTIFYECDCGYKFKMNS